MEPVLVQDVKLKVKAYKAYDKALKDGRLIRPMVCSECKEKCHPDGHHEDYTKPLEVIWLCRSCHGKRARNGIVSRIDLKAVARNMYRLDNSVTRIASMLRVHRTTVWRWCRDIRRTDGTE